MKITVTLNPGVDARSAVPEMVRRIEEITGLSVNVRVNEQRSLSAGMHNDIKRPEELY